MPPNADAPMPKLELNDQMVTDDDHDGLQPVIDHASRVAYEDRETSNFKLQMRLDSLEDALLKPTDSSRVATASSLYATNETSIKTVVPDVASAIDAKAIANDIKTFAENSKVLMKALDEIAQIHPFIAVTVLAFKAVITLELKRRDNDQKIIAIKLKMKDMMSALLELRNIKDPAQTAPDGTNIQGRMENLMQQIAADIIACGNACDAYAKKNVVVKVLKSPVWEGRLADFVAIFEQHRISIIFSLSIHTSLGVDSANHTLSSVHKNVQSVDQKLNTLLLFRTLDSPHERELMKIISMKGGPKACLEDDGILKELMVSSRSKASPKAAVSKGAKFEVADRVEFAKVKRETKEDVDDCLEINMVHFERKLELQKRQIVKEVEDVVVREGDRVISALSGPHDRIIDSDLHAIWKEMDWRGSVKARHFVLALHDYFHEKYDVSRNPDAADHLRSPSPALSETVSDVADDFHPSLTFAFANSHTKRRAEDQWALAYINILRIQSVLEAFDDDATGFISIKEVNMFSSDRPPNWTLTSWLAYWAAGWHYSVWDYRVKISTIVKTMFSTLDFVLPVNRNLVDRYMEYASGRLELLLRSVRPYDAQDDNDLQRKVQPYIAEEEERLKSTLESIAWDIDTIDTVALITGPERIEKYLFPLLYLVLRRHMQIVRLACTEVLADFEFYHASDALYYIFCAADDRIAKLSAIFKSNNLDVSTQLGNVALGMFQFLHSPSLFTKLDEDSEFIPDYSDDIPDQTNTNTLKYEPQDEFDRAAYDITDSEPVIGLDAASAGPSIMKGIWSGLYFYSNIEKTDGLMQIDIHTSSEDGSFDGRGADGLGTFTVSGQIKHNTEADMEVRFVKEYTRLRLGEKISWVYQGSLDAATGTISGKWGDEESDDLGTFRLGQAPAWVHQFRYSPSELQDNAARARWSFAKGAAIYQAKQRLWSWSFFKNRRTNRKRFLELFKRRELTNAWNFAQKFCLTEEEVKELQLLESSLMPADARFYHAIGRSEVRRLCVHFNAYCDACSSTIIDQRAACLICIFDDYSNQVDLCNSCINEAVQNRQFTHSPLHDMVQIRRVVHNRDKRNWITSAREAVTRGKFAISRPKQLEGADVNVDPKWRCSCCDGSITMPCWFCVTCVTEMFICDACNTANVPCLKDSHTEVHSLVRLNNSEAFQNGTIESRLLSIENRFGEDKKAMNERLGRLEQRFENHESVMNDRFTALETKVDGRLAAVERLLSLIASKLPS